MKLETRNDVRVFMNACDQVEVGFGNQFDLYLKLIKEEYAEELIPNFDDKVELLDAIIDTIWVAEGALNTIANSHTEYDNLEFIDKNSLSTINDSEFYYKQLYNDLIAYIDKDVEYFKFNLIGFINSIVELGYIIYGEDILQEAWNEVARSNMSKISENGKVLKNEIGKIQKPKTYSPPDIKSILNYYEF